MAPRPTLNALAAVTLDATGTLIASPAMGEIYAEVLSRHGVSVQPADVRRVFPVVWQELDCRAEVGRDRFSAHPEVSSAAVAFGPQQLASPTGVIVISSVPSVTLAASRNRSPTTGDGGSVAPAAMAPAGTQLDPFQT